MKRDKETLSATCFARSVLGFSRNCKIDIDPTENDQLARDLALSGVGYRFLSRFLSRFFSPFIDNMFDREIRPITVNATANIHKGFA